VDLAGNAYARAAASLLTSLDSLSSGPSEPVGLGLVRRARLELVEAFSGRSGGSISMD
jgi:hypothetical protein